MLISHKAFFNVMLRDFGVKGVKVQEVVSLDDEMLEFLQYVIS
jgi:ubiquitin carboxyl-terminal hydrolase L5